MILYDELRRPAYHFGIGIMIDFFSPPIPPNKHFQKEIARQSQNSYQQTQNFKKNQKQNVAQAGAYSSKPQSFLYGSEKKDKNLNAIPQKNSKHAPIPKGNQKPKAYKNDGPSVQVQNFEQEGYMESDE